MRKPPVSELVDQDSLHLDYQGLPCFSTVPRCRCPALSTTWRESSGHAYVILDGTLIPIDRVARDKPFYSGKHKKHGMNLQVIASPDGDILWVSGALPGAPHQPAHADQVDLHLCRVCRRA
jgi:DDE superfamily endonuclease